MDYGTLRVTTPDGQVREYPIDTPSVIIGRADGNRVVINHVTVSRRHARLAIDSGRLEVEDLGSASGTFVGSERIAPNNPTDVPPGEPMRFGDCEAVFLAAQAGAPVQPFVPAAAAPAGVAGPRQPVPAAAGAVPPAPGDSQQQTVAVRLISPTEPVAAGSATTATVAIQNRGPVVDELTLSVPDLPASWVRVSRPVVPLVPSGHDEVTILIQPPRSPEAIAGEYPFSVAVVSREHGLEVRALGRFTILPFEGFGMQLQPVRARRDFKVAMENKGNVGGTYELGAADDEGALRFAFNNSRADLKPGQQETVGLSVRRKKRRLLGKELVRPFHVEARAAGTPQPVATADGQLRDRAPLQPWRWPILALLFLALLGAGFVEYRNVCKGDWPVCSADSVAAKPSPTSVRGGATATAAASPSQAAASQTAPPGSPAAGLKRGDHALVVNSLPPGQPCLSVRASAALSAAKIDEFCSNGTIEVVLESDPTPNQVDHYTWWFANAGAKHGWVAQGTPDGKEMWLVPKR